MDFTIPIFKLMNGREWDTNAKEVGIPQEIRFSNDYRFSYYRDDPEAECKEAMEIEELVSGNNKTRVLAIHTRAGLLPPKYAGKLYDNVNFLTNFRDPINRELSFQQFIISEFGIEPDTIGMFYPKNGNHFIREILYWHSGDYISGEITIEHYLHATEIIDNRYFLVMLTEYFAESLYLLTKHFELDISQLNYELEFYSFGSARKEDLPNHALRHHQQKNSYDILLYEHIKRNLLKQISSLPDNQKNELNEFKSRNDSIVQKQRFTSQLIMQKSKKNAMKPGWLKMAYGTRNTIQYFENKYSDFYENLKQELSIVSVESQPNPFDDFHGIGCKLDDKLDYIVVGSKKNSEKLTKQISTYNYKYKTAIRVLYSLTPEMILDICSTAVVPINELDCIESVDILRENTVVLYGAGIHGQKRHNMLKSFGIPVSYFCDSNENYWGGETYVNGTVVLSPKELAELDKSKDIVIIISTERIGVIREIMDILSNLNLRTKRIFTTHALDILLFDKLIRNKKIIMADYEDYYKQKVRFLALGIPAVDIVNRLGYKRRNEPKQSMCNVYHISGLYSGRVAKSLASFFSFRNDKAIILEACEVNDFLVSVALSTHRGLTLGDIKLVFRKKHSVFKKLPAQCEKTPKI